MDIKLNQKVIVVGIGNNARYSTPIHKATVSKIGRKWFYIDTPEAFYVARDNKFSLEDGKSDGKGYMPEWVVYESDEAYKELTEIPKLRKEIVESLNLTYKQLLEISSFIKSFSAETESK